MLIENLTKLFTQNACSFKQPKMEAYMKNHFAFLGLASPLRKELQKNAFNSSRIDNYSHLKNTIIGLWQKPEREYQYAAIDLLIKQHKLWEVDVIDFTIELIMEKSWWDTVDLLASNILYKAVIKFKAEFFAIASKLNAKNNLWCHRSAIILQLKAAKNLDKVLLSNLIAMHKHNEHFFIQKAIGWSLRQASKHFPGWVIDQVKLQALQGLAKKEALKLLN